MPAAFSPADRTRIRAALLRAGRDLFVRQGLGKTTLRELTEPAGIHPTSFYAFFEAKESLYLELLGLEGPAVAAQLRPALELGDDCSAAIARVIRTIVGILETNPLIRRLLTHPDELAAVARRVRPEDMAAKAASLLPLREFVVAAQARGCLTPADPDVVVGVIRAATLLTLHRDDIGAESYDDVLDLLITSLARGLTAGAPPPVPGGRP